jgi:ABC-type polysaccharide/polyol phosphate transport system ATPase subunit
MGALAIEVEGLGKRYRLGQRAGQYETLREVISRGWGARAARRTAAELWALRDVSVAAEQGEAVGVIGRNGAGKTTLLKILARITEPTLGVSRTRGRVGSLLEVGTGFHPELTGRDNVYLNGAILGMSRRDIRRRFDEIVEFAGVTGFLDTPLKRYSAGMQLRLAFSVAAHLEPDIVLVDEVLAVGDAEFQQKCVGRMSDLGGEGRTVLFVSHDLGAIRKLCARSIWIDGGVVLADGPTDDVMQGYLDHHARPGPTASFSAHSDDAVDVEWVGVTDEAGTPTKPRDGQPFVIRLRLQVHEQLPDLDAGIYLLNADGLRVLSEAWHETGWALPAVAVPGRLEFFLTVPGILASGEYVIGVWVSSSEEYFFFEEVLAIDLRDRSTGARLSGGNTRVIRSPTGLRARALGNPANR